MRRTTCVLFRTAIVAVAADLHPRDRDADAGVALDLPLELLEKVAFHFAHFAATQTSHVDVVARTVAFVIMAMPVDVQQVELVEQPVAFQHFERAIYRHAMPTR